jgi:hypothetical protein
MINANIPPNDIYSNNTNKIMRSFPPIELELFFILYRELRVNYSLCLNPLKKLRNYIYIVIPPVDKKTASLISGVHNRLLVSDNCLSAIPPV